MLQWLYQVPIPGKAIREELKRCFSDQTSLGHAAAQLENMTEKPN